MAVVTCIEDLRRQYRRRVPKMFYDYVESGSWSEATFRDNAAALQAVRLRQRVLRDLSERQLASRMLGQAVAMPVALAPVGMTGMQRANGEILAAKAAEAFGVPYILSTVSICSIEDVAAHVSKPFWFQLYVMRDRDFIRRLIGRAQAAGCSALVLTVDLNILGQRHKDLKNGLTTPPKPTLRNLLDLACHPGWSLRMLGTRRRSFGNIHGHAEGTDNLRSIARWSAAQIDPSLNWEDVQWIRDLWKGPLVIKGVMDAEDAARAVQAGAQALVVSNHGGRQLDGAPASIHALPGVIAEVGGKAEVWMDGGVRSGQDVLRAMATGASGVLLGRAYIYGLGAAGQAGVTQALEIIRRELDLSMAFCGYTDINQVDSAALWDAR